tara:strand:- start:471 stop:1568 length:1098 start_codon:yes stop_codon:yes gene_type:complete
MHAIIKKEDITSALGMTMGVVEKKQTLPILANVLISFDNDGFNLLATDLESELATLGSPATVKSSGKTTTSAKKLHELCRLIPDNDDIEISLDTDKLKIKTKSGKYSLATLPSEDFPVFESSSDEIEAKINAAHLREALSSTAFAMGNQDWRHYLNGLYISISKNLITTVATDAHRLAINAVEADADNDFVGIIPRKSVNEIIRLLGDIGEDVLIKANEASLTLVTQKSVFKTKLIDGNYPDYTQVIPSGDNSTIDVNVGLLSEALSRASVLSNEKYKGVKINANKDSLYISANNPDDESANESISAKYDGDNAEIAFNVNYLQEILNQQPSENCYIQIFGPEKSCIIVPPNSDYPKYVLMPLLI